MGTFFPKSFNRFFPNNNEVEASNNHFDDDIRVKHQRVFTKMNKVANALLTSQKNTQEEKRRVMRDYNKVYRMCEGEDEGNPLI